MLTAKGTDNNTHKVPQFYSTFLENIHQSPLTSRFKSDSNRNNQTTDASSSYSLRLHSSELSLTDRKSSPVVKFDNLNSQRQTNQSLILSPKLEKTQDVMLSKSTTVLNNISYEDEDTFNIRLNILRPKTHDDAAECEDEKRSLKKTITELLRDLHEARYQINQLQSNVQILKTEIRTRENTNIELKYRIEELSRQVLEKQTIYYTYEKQGFTSEQRDYYANANYPWFSSDKTNSQPIIKITVDSPQKTQEEESTVLLRNEIETYKYNIELLLKELQEHKTYCILKEITHIFQSNQVAMFNCPHCSGDCFIKDDEMLRARELGGLPNISLERRYSPSKLRYAHPTDLDPQPLDTQFIPNLEEPFANEEKVSIPESTLIEPVEEARIMEPVEETRIFEDMMIFGMTRIIEESNNSWTRNSARDREKAMRSEKAETEEPKIIEKLIPCEHDFSCEPHNHYACRSCTEDFKTRENEMQNMIEDLKKSCQEELKNRDHLKEEIEKLKKVREEEANKQTQTADENELRKIIQDLKNSCKEEIKKQDSLKEEIEKLKKLNDDGVKKQTLLEKENERLKKVIVTNSKSEIDRVAELESALQDLRNQLEEYKQSAKPYEELALEPIQEEEKAPEIKIPEFTEIEEEEETNLQESKPTDIKIEQSRPKKTVEAPANIEKVEDPRVTELKARLKAVSQRLKDAGLKDCGLILGIDCTASNMSTGKKSFGNRHLHDISARRLNFYEQVVSIVGSILNEFNSEGRFPVYVFGDDKTRDKTVRPLYYSKAGGDDCFGVEHALAEYRKKIKKIGFSGPTSFTPLIDKAIEVCKEKQDFQLLIIIGDGAVTNMQETIDSIVKASYYPLAIVMVGVGDGDIKQYPDDPWKGMKELDEEIPHRIFDNFNFIYFEKDMLPEEFAEKTLMELPEAYKFCVENNLIAKLKEEASKKPEDDENNSGSKLLDEESKEDAQNSKNLVARIAKRTQSKNDPKTPRVLTKQDSKVGITKEAKKSDATPKANQKIPAVQTPKNKQLSASNKP